MQCRDLFLSSYYQRNVQALVIDEAHASSSGNVLFFCVCTFCDDFIKFALLRLVVF